MDSISVNGQRRIEYYDIMRIICMACVVVIHVVGHRIDDITNSTLWHTANLIEGFARFSVPVFMMITGALLLKSDKSLSVKHIYCSRVMRILVPSVIWTVIYIVLSCTKKFSSPFDTNILSGLLKNILETPVFQHLWYVYALLSFYIILPVLRLLVKNCSLRMLGYILAVWFAVGGILPTLEPLNSIFRITPDADINVRSGYIGFFLLGYFLDNIKIKIKPIYTLALYIIFSLSTSALSFCYLGLKGADLRPFYEYFSPNIIAASAFAFLFLKQIFSAIRLPEKLHIATLSEAVFGVYLCHEFVRTMLYQAVKTLNPYVEMTVSTLLTLVISFVFVLIVMKTPLAYPLTGYKKIPRQKTAGK